MEKIKYFAYGSNMCSGRLRDRVPCSFVTIAKLACHQLRFHKLSKKDGSSKGDAFHTGIPEDLVWGVVFDIPTSKKADLDRFEGLGYGYHDPEVMVTLPNSNQLLVQTYIADPESIREGVAPYSWYKAYVEAGAVEHELPRGYVERVIMSVVTTEDPDKRRHAKETAKLEAWKASRSRLGSSRER
jgi:hypothetical protein